MKGERDGGNVNDVGWVCDILAASIYVVFERVCDDFNGDLESPVEGLRLKVEWFDRGNQLSFN